MALNIVLYAPEIPQNTGNIMRTCAGTNARLHLIEPLGFKMDLKHLKRSGVNVIDQVDYRIYPDWESFRKENDGVFAYFTRYGKKSPDQFAFTDTSKEYYLVFGKESTGIPKELLREHLEDCIRLPMNDRIRSLNLANVVAAVLYEALRQQGYPGLSRTEPDTLKGEDWLLKP